MAPKLARAALILGAAVAWWVFWWSVMWVPTRGLYAQPESSNIYLWQQEHPSWVQGADGRWGPRQN